MIEKVVFIGAGNLATQLALALKAKDVTIQQIYSHTHDNARKLGQQVNAPYTSELSQLVKDADIYILAVKDSAIKEVLENLSLNTSSLIVHTAGSVPMEILKESTHHYGVFYPLQTFSRERNIDFSNIPICIEAGDCFQLMELEKLAKRISSSVHMISSEERKTLHLAAVFANNFVNHIYGIGYDILHQKGLDFDLLKPLIRETAEKIQVMDPLEAQTGPAKRNDRQVIDNHLIMLKDQPELQKIYSFVSESIYHLQQKYNNDLL